MELAEALELFGAHLAAERGFAPATWRAYRSDLNGFAAFAAERFPGRSVESLDRAMLESYLTAEGWRPATSLRRRTALRALFDFLERRGAISRNPCRGLAGVKWEKSASRVLSKEEVRAIVDAPGSPRDRALLEVLCSGRFGVAELVSLNIGDVDPWNGTARAGGRTVPLGEPALEALRASLKARGLDWGRAGSERAPLFANRDGGRLSVRWVHALTSARARGAGLPYPANPRVLRRAGIGVWPTAVE